MDLSAKEQRDRLGMEADFDEGGGAQSRGEIVVKRRPGVPGTRRAPDLYCVGRVS